MGKLKPLIYWEGFPACGLIIKEVVDEFENIIILATRYTKEILYFNRE